MSTPNGDPGRSDALVLFGATGDVAYKKIFPALYATVDKIFITTEGSPTLALSVPAPW
jgi:glucose-6-phosphate 1-dehydrogenase